MCPHLRHRLADRLGSRVDTQVTQERQGRQSGRPWLPLREVATEVRREARPSKPLAVLSLQLEQVGAPPLARDARLLRGHHLRCHPAQVT